MIMRFIISQYQCSPAGQRPKGNSIMVKKRDRDRVSVCVCVCVCFLPEMGAPFILQVSTGLGIPSAWHSRSTVSPGAYCRLWGCLVMYGAATHPPPHNQPHTHTHPHTL